MYLLRKSLFVAIVVLIGLVTATAHSYAGPLVYQTGFENPPFVAGLSLVDQDGWSGVPPLSPDAAVILTDKPRQGKQSVLVLGEDLVHQDFINQLTGGYYDAIGSYRKPVNYDTGGMQTVRVSAHVLVEGPQTPTGNNFFSASIAARGAIVSDGGTTGIGELAISSDGHVYGYSGDDDVPTFLTSASITLGEWHDLAVEADFATRHFAFFVDGQSLGTFPFPGSPQFAGNFLARGSLIVYAAPDTATAHKADYAAHFDHFTIQGLGHK